MGCWQENGREGARKRDPADLGLPHVLGTDLTFGKPHSWRMMIIILHEIIIIIIISQALVNV